MQFFRQSRIALFYPAAFSQTDELEALLHRQKIELRLVEPEALELSLAALAGDMDAPPANPPFKGSAPAASGIVFANLTEQRLQSALQALREASLPPIAVTAVFTGENRNQAFGALLEQATAE